MVDIFDTVELVQVVPNLLLSQNFLLDTFFPNIVTAESEFVAIDVDVGKRRMSPFVSPLVENFSVLPSPLSSTSPPFGVSM